MLLEDPSSRATSTRTIVNAVLYRPSELSRWEGGGWDDRSCKLCSIWCLILSYSASIYPKQKGDISVGVSCLPIVSTSLVYCSTIRHHDVTVKFHAHFYKYSPVWPSSSGRCPALPLLVATAPVPGLGLLRVGGLGLSGPGTPAEKGCIKCREKTGQTVT